MCMYLFISLAWYLNMIQENEWVNVLSTQAHVLDLKLSKTILFGLYYEKKVGASWNEGGPTEGFQ